MGRPKVIELLVSVENLTVRYELLDGNTFNALTGISMRINRGQIVGVVGESGAGKSTIGKAALGLLDENAVIESGNIKLDDSVLTQYTERDFAPIRGKRIGYIYQNPMTALNPVLTIGEQLIETIQAHTDKRGQVARNFAIELLKKVEIFDAETRLSKYPHQLSGGLCQRIVFAIAICSKPDLIIADEPTTALDVTIQKAVLDTFKQLAQKENIAVILITHDMGVVAEMCDYVYVLRHGLLVEHGPTQHILMNPKETYSRELMAAIPRVDQKIDRFLVPGIIQNSEGRDRALTFLNRKVEGQNWEQTSPLLSVRKLSKTFISPATLVSSKKSFKAVDSVSFDVFKGETLGIVGESGSGKSTIGRMILGLLNPDYKTDIDSNVIYRGVNISDLKTRAERHGICQSMQCIFQDPYSSLNPRMSAGENITFAVKAHGAIPRSKAWELAADLMELVGLPRNATGKMPHAFSGGERQRIGIARALSFQPDFMFCDEPTSALDVTVQAKLLNLIKDLQDALGLTLVFVSHDLAVVRQMCNRVLVMKSGQVVESGTTEKILGSPDNIYTKELLNSMPRFTFQ
jgi:peptide/nickel transport system ATP-binding protein